MAIPANFLDELVSRSDIVDVVGSYVTLNRKGGRYWGCCPFHNEKTPSFSVNTERQQYYCFGCHKGGGIINFIMDVENLPFPDAVRLLADKAGMEVPEDNANREQSHRREHLLQLNKEAARYYHQRLKAPEGKPMLNYLLGRKLTPRTITTFGLGAAPDGWDDLISAMAKKGYSKTDLIDAGLAVKSQKGRIYDRFRNRVMFPIIDLRGNVIAFGGRVMDDSTPKYLNSPDTVIFSKRENLFALNLARRSKQGKILLTEGYMDTIALHQAGFDYAVASLGTSLTEKHAKLISRYAKEVIISYDGDSAGVQAAQRAITILEQTGLPVKVLQVRGAKDPDEFIQKYGSEAFERLINQSESQVEYRLELVRRKYNLEQDEQRVAYLQEAAALVATLNSPVEREIYGTRAAEAAKFSPQAMAEEVRIVRTRLAKREEKKETRTALNPINTSQPRERSLRYQDVKSAMAEEGILRLMELDATLFPQVAELTPEDFSSPFLGKVFSIFRARWQAGEEIRVPALAGELTNEEMNQLVALMQKPESLANASSALADYIKTIQKQKLKRQGLTSPEQLLAFRQQKANGGTTT